MCPRNLISALIICLINFTYAENITVLDSKNSKPIPNVSIYNQSDLLGTTDSNGVATIPALDDTVILTFKHTVYEDSTLSFGKLNALKLTVTLSKSIITLSKTIVTANKWEEDKSEVTAKISTVSKKDVEFYNPQTTADLLSASNEIFVQKSQLGGGSPMIRGFAANSILLVVDGVRMNNAIYRSGNLQNVISLDANTIENTEIIFGPGSIIYGSDALGGVLSFTSKNPLLSGNEICRVSGDAMGRSSSANIEKTGHLTVNIGTKLFGSLSSFTYSDYENLRMGKNGDFYHQYKRPEYVDKINSSDSVVQSTDAEIQLFTGYYQINILQKFLLHPSDRFDLRTGFYFSTTSDVPRYDRLIEYKDGTLKYAEWYYGPQQWMMINSAMHIAHALPVFDEMKINVAYQKYEESRHDRKYQKDGLRSRTETVDVVTGNCDFNKNIGKKNFFAYGIEGVYNNVISTGKEKNIKTDEVSPVSTRYPDGFNDYITGAVYLYLKTNWHEKFTSVIGARYSHIYLKSYLEDKTFYNFPFSIIKINTGAFNESIGFVLHPFETWKISLNASSGFRAPNIDDVAKVFDSEPGVVIVPNDDLKPEYAYNIDFGTEADIGNFLGVEATVFGTYLKDLMVRDDFTFNGRDSIMYDGEMSKVKAMVNKGKGYLAGGSAGIKVTFTDYLSLKSYLTYTWGEDEDGLPIRHTGPLFGSTHLIYSIQKFMADFYLHYNGSIKYEDLADSEKGKTYIYAMDDNGNPHSPAWITLNLKTSYKFNNHFKIDAGIENIANTCYRPYSSGIVAPGINGIFTARVSF